MFLDQNDHPRDIVCERYTDLKKRKSFSWKCMQLIYCVYIKTHSMNIHSIITVSYAPMLSLMSYWSFDPPPLFFKNVFWFYNKYENSCQNQFGC